MTSRDRHNSSNEIEKALKAKEYEMKEKKWTKPCYGVSHYYRDMGDYRWATVREIREDWYETVYWSKDCGFSPEKETFNSLEEARVAGEWWANSRGC